MSAWSIDRARRTYAVPHWGEGYFDIGAEGGIEVLPRGREAVVVRLAGECHEVLGAFLRGQLLVMLAPLKRRLSSM